MAHGSPANLGSLRADWEDQEEWRVPGFPLIEDSARNLGGRSRAGMLRGFGNGIVLPLATAFIESLIDVLVEDDPL